MNPIDRYLKKLPEPQRSTLTRVRRLIAEILPERTECISYGIPAFKVHGAVVGGIAAGKNHCSYYPFSGGTLKTLRKLLAKFDQTKSALHFPHDQPLGKSVMRHLIRTRLAEIKMKSKKADKKPISMRKGYSQTGQKLSFFAELENWTEGMDYCAVAVPALITKKLGTNCPVLVMAQVNASAPFKVSLFPVGGGKHYIRIRAQVRKEAKTKTGDRVRLKITVLDRAFVSYPPDLLGALRAEGLILDFKSLPPGEQNFILRRIDEAAKPETRQKRIQDAVMAANRRREKLADRR